MKCCIGKRQDGECDNQSKRITLIVWAHPCRMFRETLRQKVYYRATKDVIGLLTCSPTPYRTELREVEYVSRSWELRHRTKDPGTEDKRDGSKTTRSVGKSPP